jgi:hypothetical protein
VNKVAEFFKKHPYAAGGAVLVGLIVVYLLMRNSGGSGGGNFSSLAASQQQGQLQLAQLNAQESAASEQTQAQLAAEEYQGNLQAEESQNQLVGGLASSIIPAQLQSELAGQELGYENNEVGAEESLYSQELSNQLAEEQGNIPLEQSAIGVSLSGNGRAPIGAAELAELLGESQPSELEAVSPLAQIGQGTNTGFGITLGNGLFGNIGLNASGL